MMHYAQRITHGSDGRALCVGDTFIELHADD